MSRNIVLIGGRSGIGAALLNRLVKEPETQVWNFSREDVPMHAQVKDQRWDAGNEFDPKTLELPDTLTDWSTAQVPFNLHPFIAVSSFSLSKTSTSISLGRFAFYKPVAMDYARARKRVLLCSQA